MSARENHPDISSEPKNSSIKAPSRVASSARPARRGLASLIAIIVAITGSGLIAAVPASAKTTDPANVGTVAKVKSNSQTSDLIWGTLPNAQVGFQYSAQTPYDYFGNPSALTSNLPAGLSASSKGLITGVPTQAPGDYKVVTRGSSIGGNEQLYYLSIHIDWPVWARDAPMTLNMGEFLQLGKRKFVMQTDGNLVLYDDKGVVFSATNTYSSKPTNYHVTFQADCNVVIRNSRGRAAWASNTARSDNSCSGGVVQVTDKLRFFDGTSNRTIAWDSSMAGIFLPDIYAP